MLNTADNNAQVVMEARVHRSPSPSLASYILNASHAERWLRLEEEVGLADKETAEQARLNLKEIEKMSSRFRESGLPPDKVVLGIYKLMEEMGYSYAVTADGTEVIDSGTLTKSLTSKKIDCDTSSAIVYGIARDLGIKGIKLMLLPGHVYLRLNGENFDFGEKRADEFYTAKFKISPTELPAETALLSNMYYAVAAKISEDKRYIESKELYSTAISLSPKHDESYSNRGRVSYELRQFKESLDDYNKAISIKGDNSLHYFRRGNFYRELGEHRLAYRDYTTAIKLDPSDTDTLFNRADVLNRLKRYKDAVKDNLKLISITPKDAGAYNNLGISYFNLKKYKKALESYSTAIELEPQNWSYFFNRAITFGKIKAHQKALADYNRVLELDPSNATALSARDTTIYILGRHKNGKTDSKGKVR